MYTKYTKSGYSKSSAKKDIKELPFDEIQEDYSGHYNHAVEVYLEDVNNIAMNAWKRKSALARADLYKNSEESEEEVDDSLRDYTPIEDVPADEASKFREAANDYAVLAFVDKYNIKEAWEWLGPQLLAHLGTYKLPEYVDKEVTGSSGTKVMKRVIVGSDFLDLNVTTPRELGIYRFITKVARGKLMEKQVLPEHTPYCSLVPLYMAAQKKFSSIKYTDWDPTTVKPLVDKDLYAAMVCDPPMGKVTDDELLQIRHVGLSYISRSAKERGQTKYYNPETYHTLSGIGDSAIGNLPKYAKVMLCQIWSAHPKNRNQYMILDPYDWDRMPPPLINSTILAHRQVSADNAGTTVYRSSTGSSRWE